MPELAPPGGSFLFRSESRLCLFNCISFLRVMNLVGDVRLERNVFIGKQGNPEGIKVTPVYQKHWAIQVSVIKVSQSDF